MTEIKNVVPESPAVGRIASGEFLVSINGTPIRDVLDYQFYSYDTDLLITTKTGSNQWKITHIKKQPGENLGLSFSDYLMDKPRTCANRCVFCFIDQMPKGLRDTLYFKDDDVRLSFLTGNYISLTNLSEAELERVIRLKISPINISVQATDPEIRIKLLGNANAGRCMEIMTRFAQTGITMNAQIVVCPGINDGAVLSQTMADLENLYPALQSVSVVPVGLTRHREGLAVLTPFDRMRACTVLLQVETFAAHCFRIHGTRLFFPADELYLMAEASLPGHAFYEDYPQLENGVGLMRSFQTEFEKALDDLCASKWVCRNSIRPFSIATGVSAAPFLRNLLQTSIPICDILDVHIYPIHNDFFGENVTVAGLITGEDLIAQLTGRSLGERLLIPRTMLRHGEDVFLDDVTTATVSNILGVPVIPVDVNGTAFLDAILACRGEPK